MMMEKRRWLLVDSLGVGDAEFPACVSEAVKDFLGLAGLAKAKAKGEVVEGKQVVRCSRASVEEVVAALAFKTDYKGRRVALRTAKVSGTLNALLGGKRATNNNQ